MGGESRTNPTALPPTPDGWRAMQIEELCERVTSGGTPSRQRPEYYENGVFSWFKTKELKDCALYDSEERITQDALDSSSAKLFPPNTVLMAMYGDGITITSLGILRREAATNQACCAMIPKSTVCEPRFLFYSLLNHREDFIRIASGGAQRNLSGSLIRRFALNAPPLAEQQAIVAILGALDDKIELNRKVNVTLEAMARALFQSWFVDFDPVRAKLDGRQPVGMDEATAEMFPATFQDSPIGPVPQGWTVERFDVHITADRGLSYKGEGLRDDSTGLPMHNLNSIYEGGGYKHEGLKYYAGEYRDKHLLEPGDMIVTNTEQGFDHLLIGHAAIVPRCYGTKGLYSHHIYRVRHAPSSPFSPHYLVELFNNPRWHYWISGFSNGTTINMLPMDALEMPMLVVPPVELVKRFTDLAEAAHLQVEDNKQQSRTLATLRDTLLPRLLSGELGTENVAQEVVP